MADFLPFCDVLFNIISLAGYFCNVVFNALLGYALLERGRTVYFAIVLCLVISSLVITQVVSLGWYLSELKVKSETENEEGPEIDEKVVRRRNIQKNIIIGLHVMQLGVLWRYAKLFVPIDLRRVKNEVRDLCMLRLIHAFSEAAPMLLMQLYILVTIESDSTFLSNAKESKLKSLSGHSVGVVTTQSILLKEQSEKTFKDLNIVSATLSLFTVCWALASFSKNVRAQNVHRLVLTWLGVIFQFFWRLGTVISRVASLTMYASLYKYWIFLVLSLHWFSMFLWLISPKNIFHGEKISKARKITWSLLIAFVYIFAYINLQEVNHRQKIIIFYVVMFLENVLLLSLWIVGIWSNRPEMWFSTPFFVIGAFVAGLFFMFLYYRFFHIRRLNWTFEDPDVPTKQKKCANQPITAGVFNCRFANHAASTFTKRKKKKPTTFIPPPSILENSGPMLIPFWRRPLSQSIAGSSENEGSVGSSRVNIHQKLAEKKQKQLAELKIIEEEIKQGKICVNKDTTPSTSQPRQPIPRSKKHINIESLEWNAQENKDDNKHFNNLDELNNLNSSEYNPIYTMYSNIHKINNYDDYSFSRMSGNFEGKSKHDSYSVRNNFPRQGIYNSNFVSDPKFPHFVVPPPKSKLDRWSFQKKKTHVHSDIYSGQVLKPSQLMSSPHVDNSNLYFQLNENKKMTLSSGDENLDLTGIVGVSENIVASDIESLPRSYTLPREFRYYRKKKFVQPFSSTNSSDGDVDSGDENESDHQTDLQRKYRNRTRPLKSPIAAINYNFISGKRESKIETQL